MSSVFILFVVDIFLVHKRFSSLMNEFGSVEKNFGLIKEFKGRVSNWMKSFTEESADRRTDIHKKYFESLFTSS